MKVSQGIHCWQEYHKLLDFGKRNLYSSYRAPIKKGGPVRPLPNASPKE